MKNQNFQIFLVALMSGFYSCNSNDAIEQAAKPETSVHNKVVNVTHHDGRSFNNGISSNLTGKYVANPGGGVMMQAFYWDVPAGGNWWNTLSAKVTDWGNAGIGAIWLPPVSKAQNGPFSMGYDPTDYFDFGNFNQNGTTNRI